jgi:hypothetical protein
MPHTPWPHAKDDNFSIKVAPVEQSVNVFQFMHWLLLVKNSGVTDRRIRIAPQPREFGEQADARGLLGATPLTASAGALLSKASGRREQSELS